MTTVLHLHGHRSIQMPQFERFRLWHHAQFAENSKLHFKGHQCWRELCKQLLFQQLHLGIMAGRKSHKCINLEFIPVTWQQPGSGEPVAHSHLWHVALAISFNNNYFHRFIRLPFFSFSEVRLSSTLQSPFIPDQFSLGTSSHLQLYLAVLTNHIFVRTKFAKILKLT